MAAFDGKPAKFKLLKRVVVVDDLPGNEMGTVQKNVLQGWFDDLYALSARVP